MADKRSVVPLESNPDVFTSFAHDLGLDESYSFVDIYSLSDPDLVAFVPRPVKALILLFPLNSFFETAKNDKTIANEELTAKEDQPIWFKQTIRNACGLYGLLNSLGNNKELLNKDSKLLEFLEAHPKFDGQYSDTAADDFVVYLSELNSDKFQQGQTEAPEAEQEVNLHFITFIQHNGLIYELDGRRPQGARLLSTIDEPGSDVMGQKSVADRLKWYMDNADEQSKLNFSLIGLAPSWD